MSTWQRDPLTGNIYLKTDPELWTPETWAAKIKAVEKRLAQVQDQLASAMSIKDKPDGDTLALWNSVAAEQKRPLEEEVGQLQVELAEMKAV